jgi:hypothetical protein
LNRCRHSLREYLDIVAASPSENPFDIAAAASIVVREFTSDIAAAALSEMNWNAFDIEAADV